MIILARDSELVLVLMRLDDVSMRGHHSFDQNDYFWCWRTRSIMLFTYRIDKWGRVGWKAETKGRLAMSFDPESAETRLPIFWSF